MVGNKQHFQYLCFASIDLSLSPSHTGVDISDLCVQMERDELSSEVARLRVAAIGSSDKAGRLISPFTVP